MPELKKPCALKFILKTHNLSFLRNIFLLKHYQIKKNTILIILIKFLYPFINTQKYLILLS